MSKAKDKARLQPDPEPSSFIPVTETVFAGMSRRQQNAYQKDFYLNEIIKLQKEYPQLKPTGYENIGISLSVVENWSWEKLKDLHDAYKSDIFQGITVSTDTTRQKPGRPKKDTTITASSLTGLDTYFANIEREKEADLDYQLRMLGADDDTLASMSADQKREYARLIRVRLGTPAGTLAGVQSTGPFFRPTSTREQFLIEGTLNDKSFVLDEKNQLVKQPFPTPAELERRIKFMSGIVQENEAQALPPVVMKKLDHFNKFNLMYNDNRPEVMLDRKRLQKVKAAPPYIPTIQKQEYRQGIQIA